MKNKQHDPTEPVDKQFYKKNYLVRKLEEQEAEEAIKEYEKEDAEQREQES